MSGSDEWIKDIDSVADLTCSTYCDCTGYGIPVGIIMNSEVLRTPMPVSL
jgi:hypothetical protein